MGETVQLGEIQPERILSVKEVTSTFMMKVEESFQDSHWLLF